MNSNDQGNAEDWKVPGVFGGANEVTRGVVDYLKVMVEVKRSAMMANTQTPLPHGWCYAGMEDFLLKHGRFWTPRPLPSHIPHMTPKMCFENAFKLASRRKDLRYVEGIAVGVIPVHHAWCVDADGNVIDPTWASTQTDLGEAYFGVAFPIDTVRTVRRRDCLCVLNNWKTGFEIFKQPFTER